MNKREFLKNSFLGATALLYGKYIIASETNKIIQLTRIYNDAQKTFILPPLGYSFDALEPYIDAQTMEIHFTKHYAGYLNNFNLSLLENNISENDLLKILAQVSKYPKSVRNNGGGYYNHMLFWQVLTPGGSKYPHGQLLTEIEKQFGSFESFKQQFNQQAMSVFGSGWTWLIKTTGGLAITTTPNQDCPIMNVIDKQGTPILMVDMWEHAYYLKYQNRRAEYLNSFWQLVNWDIVAKLYNV